MAFASASGNTTGKKENVENKKTLAIATLFVLHANTNTNENKIEASRSFLTASIVFYFFLSVLKLSPFQERNSKGLSFWQG